MAIKLLPMANVLRCLGESTVDSRQLTKFFTYTLKKRSFIEPKKNLFTGTREDPLHSSWIEGDLMKLFFVNVKHKALDVGGDGVG